MRGEGFTEFQWHKDRRQELLPKGKFKGCWEDVVSSSLFLNVTEIMEWMREEMTVYVG